MLIKHDDLKNYVNSRDFLKLDNQSIVNLIKLRNGPRCVAIMLDGTRRILKLEPGFHEDDWLYYENHIEGLIFKSLEVTDFFFNMGVENIVGPLVSYGNLHRDNFMPTGLKHLLDPLFKDYSISIYRKHKVAISLYGDLDYIRSMNGGDILEKYIERLKEISDPAPKKRILLGLGFSTDLETALISKIAIRFYARHKRSPEYEDLLSLYFGFKAKPIDIFIRSNEIRPSGGLTPLLTNHDTQFYFPVSPGIISLSEKVIRLIMHDYLFNRVLSHGMHEHQPITHREAKVLKGFYFKSRENVVGIGRRIGDLWINMPEKL